MLQQTLRLLQHSSFSFNAEPLGAQASRLRYKDALP